MSYRFEIVITVWEDGLYRRRVKTEANDWGTLEPAARHLVEDLEEKMATEAREARKRMEDDDIPF